MSEIQKYFSDFSIRRKLGKGGQGSVLLAQKYSDGNLYALKIFKKKYMSIICNKNRFEREVEVLRALNNPNIVKIFDYDLENKYPYYLMEYCENGTLRNYISKNRLSFFEYINGFIDIMYSLHEMHKKNFIHRDIKPENILLDHNNTFKISDFGLVKIRDFKELSEEIDKKTLTWDSYVPFYLGTPYYCSPEQFKSPKKVTAKADIYSLGITMHEIITKKTHNSKLVGTYINSKSNHNEFIKKIQKDFIEMKSTPSEVPLFGEFLDAIIDATSDHELSNDTIDDLSNIIVSMIHYEPNNRPDNFMDVIDSFLEIRDKLIDKSIFTDNVDQKLLNQFNKEFPELL